MKFLAAILILMIAAQPVQAGFCDMDPSGGSDVHAGMQHGDAARGDEHGCCQPADAGSDTDSDTDCADMPCGTCAAGVLAVLSAPALAAPLPDGAYSDFGDGRITPSHAAPPYRPPSFIS
jgi:hypothetical protein